MKAIRIEIYEQTANFRIENNYVLRKSYPLPPFSTVIGMIHKACNFKEYHPMKIGILGNSASTHIEFNTAYFFGTGKAYREGRHFHAVQDSKEKKIGIYRSYMRTQILNDLSIIIYVVPPENEFDVVLNGLKDPAVYLSLGRHEDLIQINKIEVVELNETSDIEYGLNKHYTYIPFELIDGKKLGTLYNIRKEFYYDENGLRKWKSTPKVLYTNKDTGVKAGYEDDKYRQLVFLV